MIANITVGKQITAKQLIEERIIMTISKEMIMNIGITSETSRVTPACIYYYYSTHRPLSSMHLSGETVHHEHLWDRSPFVCAVRGRREHEEQIVVNTRAVYPGSGRDVRVKPYSCLGCIEFLGSGA